MVPENFHTHIPRAASRNSEGEGGLHRLEFRGHGGVIGLEFRRHGGGGVQESNFQFGVVTLSRLKVNSSNMTHLRTMIHS